MKQDTNLDVLVVFNGVPTGVVNINILLYTNSWYSQFNEERLFYLSKDKKFKPIDAWHEFDHFIEYYAISAKDLDNIKIPSNYSIENLLCFSEDEKKQTLIYDRLNDVEENNFYEFNKK